MANQLDLQQVLYIDGSPLKIPAHKSVLTSDILVYEIDSSAYTGASTVIQWYSNTSNQLAYTSLYCADSFATIMGLAGTSLVQVSVLEINQNPLPTSRLYAFPVNGIGIQESGMGVSTITFKGNTYLVSGNINDLIASSNIGGYKVYTALLTQSGGYDQQFKYIGTDYGNTLTIGVTYTIVNNDTTDFINVGAPNNDIGTSFVATGTTPSNQNSNGETYVYYNTGAPIVTVLENTIGNIWFNYEDVGAYGCQSNDLFTTSKTFISATPTIETNAVSIVITNQLESVTYISPLNNSLNAFDNGLYNTPIEIRVYS